MGFTGLEAEVYVFLLREPVVTGYRVAQAIGKPIANTYKAIASLQAKGAVLVDEGESRVCRAVPAEEMLARLERGFMTRRSEAAAALASIADDAPDERIYQLRTVEQVLERARAMLARCRHLAVLDVFPEPLAALKEEVERAAAAGKTIAMKVYSPFDAPGVKIVASHNPEQILAGWPGQHLGVAIDGLEHMLALLGPAGGDDPLGGAKVRHAVWSASIFLAVHQHDSILNDLRSSELIGLVKDGAPLDRMREAVAWYEKNGVLATAGCQELISRARGEGQADEDRAKRKRRQ
jgi:sugar-specific transcriptional regulator TrmB